MKILAQIDKSREGNDCWIYEEWVLVEIFGYEMLFQNRKFSTDVGGVTAQYIPTHLEHYPEVKKIYKELKRKYLIELNDTPRYTHSEICGLLKEVDL